MRKIILSLLLFLSYTTLFAQPAGYTPGTQVCWTYNGRPHGYFKAAGSGERHILISFTGDGENSCANYQGQAPQKWLNDAGTNWDGRTVRAPGDTIVWEVLTIAHTSSFYIPAYASDIDYFFQHIASIDTSDHRKFHIEGLSGGVGRFWGYVTNNQGHNSPYRNIFSTTISQSGVSLVNLMDDIKPYSVGKRHWVWYGTADANGGTPPSASTYLYDSLRGTKHLTAQLGSGHGADTWDSCMTLTGSDTVSSRWLWMVKNDTVVPPYVPCPDPGGGPSAYVPGTQVCWTFNGRDHGYFRAEGCGERHILVSFTGDGGTDCSNYQDDSPQKWLEDAGINWNGKTVRAPGDTILWEVLTIPYNSGYWMPNYASDIAYFFQHIATGVDTSDHTKIHIEGFSGGVGRMWGYLANDQSHNSPYRSVFSTTISISTPWLGNLSAVRATSGDKRNWVWYGTADTYGPTPPAASVDLYDSISGYKRVTAQLGGMHDAGTWDSCLSLAGSDTNTSRWLWMVTPGGSGLRHIMAAPAPVTKKVAPVQGILTPEVSAYPNPVTNNKLRIVLSSTPAEQWELTVVDIQGRLLKRIPGIRAQQYLLDVTPLGKGIYFAQVRGHGFTKQIRFVKD
jgi:hypothetical protein